MLTLNQILQTYPENLKTFEKSILREYLQYKILEIIAQSKYANKLSFLGGTALRIIYGNSRFSEDLDFDNFSLSHDGFQNLVEHVKFELDLQGFETEISVAGVDAYRCNIKFPNILFDNKLSTHVNEKILLQIDTLAQNYSYSPDLKILNKFDVFTEVLTTPLDILLSQKLFASINRKRPKGRDFFDIVFLMSITKPDIPFLKQKMKLKNMEDFKVFYLEKIKDFDFGELSADVAPFLFKSSDSIKVKKFKEFFSQSFQVG